MQISLHTASSAETYVTNHEWRIARLPRCPLHPKGGCSFARHGSYPRVTPRGLRIARWYCPEGHRTFSLLPDFLAVRLPELLDSIEESVILAHSAKSLEAAADLLRGPDVGLPGAIRWLRRRVQSVRAALAAVTRLAPMPPVGIDVDERHFLRKLRRSLPATVLATVPAPLGFEAFRQAGRAHNDVQQEVGPDGTRRHRYGWAFNMASASCDANSRHRCPRQQYPPWKTCSASGARIAACKTPVLAITFDGSSGFASMRLSMDSMNAPS
jgi:hypothetical protein